MGRFDCKLPVAQSISEVQHLANVESAVIPLSRSQNIPLQNDMGMDVSDWQQRIVIYRTQLLRTVDAVRDKLLDWALELDKRGIEGEDMSFNEKERKSAQNQIFNIQNATGIFGNVSSSKVAIYDYSSIQQAVKEAGVPRDARNEIEDILDELKKAESAKRKSLLKRGKQWVIENQELLGATASIVLKALGAKTES